MTYITDLVAYLDKENVMTDELHAKILAFDTERKVENRNKNMPYGKYAGKSIAETIEFDEKYVRWFVAKAKLHPEQRIAMANKLKAKDKAKKQSEMSEAETVVVEL